MALSVVAFLGSVIGSIIATVGADETFFTKLIAAAAAQARAAAAFPAAAFAAACLPPPKSPPPISPPPLSPPSLL